MAVSTRTARPLSGSAPASAVPARTLVQTVGRLETRPRRSRVPSGTAREVVARLIEFPHDESELAGDVGRLGAGLQLAGQNVPCIGLDLEVGREGLRLQRLKGREQRVSGRVEVAEIGEKNRHMTMDAP